MVKRVFGLRLGFFVDFLRLFVGFFGFLCFFYSELVSNCPGSFLIVLAVVFVVLVVVLVALEVVLEQVKVVASYYCYRC